MSGWLPHDPGPHWGEVGIHGIHRQREWDEVVVVDAPPGGVAGETHVVVLAGGRIVGDAAGADDLLHGLHATPPYRAWLVPRRDGRVGVAVRRIDVVEIRPDPGGSSLELVWDGIERVLRIDGEPSPAPVPELERLGRERHPTFVVTAHRLDGDDWEVLVAPL